MKALFSSMKSISMVMFEIQFKNLRTRCMGIKYPTKFP